MIPTKHLYAGIGIIALAIVGGIVLHAYIGARLNQAKAEQVHEDVQSQIAALREDLSSQIAKIDKDKAEVKTPQQVVVKIPEYIPNLPVQPVVISPQPSSSSTTTSSASALPDAPSTTISGKDQTVTGKPVDGGIFFPKEDVKPLFDYMADCKANTLKLNECQKELPLVIKERDAWKTAAKGGSFWNRLKSNAKWMAIGAAAGATAGIAATH